jgi:hypothetical protein
MPANPFDPAIRVAQHKGRYESDFLYKYQYDGINRVFMFHNPVSDRRMADAALV